MPKKDIDYSKTVIYKIVCKDLNIKDCYVGTTTNFIKRKCNHKERCDVNHEKGHYKLYKTIRDNGGWENWTMLEIEKFPCIDGNESRTRERYFIELLNANLNHVIPTQTKKEYTVKNTVKKQKYDIELRKQKYNCECGSCELSLHHKSKHLKSKKHINYFLKL